MLATFPVSTSRTLFCLLQCFSPLARREGFEQQRVRLVAFIFAVAVFLFAVVRTAMLPL